MKTLRASLIGAGIGRSRFADALGIMCAQQGVALEFEPVDTAGNAGFDFWTKVDSCRSSGWTGVSVTHPFKPLAARYADTAMASDLPPLGACNTLIFSPELVGANTDYTGFIDAWRAVFTTRMPGRVAFAGAGGVAHAVAPALAGLGAAQIDIWDTDQSLARDLAARIGPVARAISLQDSPHSIRAADGLVNATPLGMTGHSGSAIAPDLIGGQSWAFDAVYTPVETTFLGRARAAGLAILSGFDLFRFMAIRSFTTYTGLTPDLIVTLKALKALKPTEERL